MAFARVKGTVRCPATVCLQTVRGGGDACDLLVGRDLVEQIGQHGRVANITGGELRRPDVQRLLINSPLSANAHIRLSGNGSSASRAA